MVQDIIVYLIGIVVLCVIVWKIYSFILRSKNKDISPCSTCSGCDIKREFDKKQAHCSKNGIEKDKNDHLTEKKAQ